MLAAARFGQEERRETEEHGELNKCERSRKLKSQERVQLGSRGFSGLRWDNILTSYADDQPSPRKAINSFFVTDQAGISQEILTNTDKNK